MCGIRVTAERRTDAVEFVCGHRRTDTTPADQYTDLSGAVLHGFADLFRVVRIIVRDRTVVRAEIRYLMTRFRELCDYPFVERITTMICSNCNSHYVILKNLVNLVLRLKQPPGVLHHIINIEPKVLQR